VINRRQFLTASAALTTGAILPPSLRAAESPANLLKGKAEHCIFIWLGGGMGQMGMREELAITRQACGQDYRTYCQGVQPGGGRAITCLESNAQSLSPGCQKALLEMKQRMGK